jgi:hypothetical protein
VGALLGRLFALHRHLGLKAFDVPEDGCGSQHASVALEAQEAVPCGNVAVDLDLVPSLGMADVIDRDVVMLAPEERHGSKFLALAEHVQCRGAPLSFRNHPMLDPNVLAAVRIGPSRNVARREDSRRARFQKGVYRDAAVKGQSRGFGERGPRPNAIGPQDWAGWDKERGLYFAARWDEAYQPLLSMHDVNEQPLLGALVSGQFGKGRHTHTSLVLHHQLDKLVPGAFQLMANLVQPA